MQKHNTPPIGAHQDGSEAADALTSWPSTEGKGRSGCGEAVSAARGGAVAESGPPAPAVRQRPGRLNPRIPHYITSLGSLLREVAVAALCYVFDLTHIQQDNKRQDAL